MNNLIDVSWYGPEFKPNSVKDVSWYGPEFKPNSVKDVSWYGPEFKPNSVKDVRRVMTGKAKTRELPWRLFLSRQAVLVVILPACFTLSSCGSSLDREYRLRFWEKCRIASKQAMHKRKYTDANQLAAEAVSQAQGFGESDFRYGVSLRDLADIEKKRGKAKTAEANYKKAIRVLQDAEKNFASKEALAKKQGRSKDRAEADLDQRLAREDLANTYAELADLYESKGHYKEASENFEKAADAYQSLLSEDHWQVDDCPLGQELVCSLMGLARVSVNEKDPQKADLAYKRALDYALSSYCPEFLLRELRDSYMSFLLAQRRRAECISLIADVNCLKATTKGTAAYHARDLKAAEQWFKQALQMAEQSVYARRRVMSCLLNLCSVLVRENYSSELENYFNLADSYMQTRKLRFDRDFDRILAMESNYYLGRNRIQKAVSILDQQIAFRSRQYGANSIEVCESLALRGTAENMAGLYKDAERTALVTYRILKAKHFTDKRANNAITFTAQLFTSLNHAPEAIELENQAYENQMRRMDAKDIRVVAFKSGVYMTYLRFMRHDECFRVAQEIEKTVETGTSEQRTDAFPYLVLMLDLTVKSNFMDVAEPLARAGQSVLKKEFGGVISDPNNKAAWERSLAKLSSATGKSY